MTFGRCFVAFVTLLAAIGLPAAVQAAPQVSWSPGSTAQTLEVGKNLTLPFTFTLSPDAGTLDLEVEVVPALQGFVSAAPSLFTGVQGGETHTVQLTFDVPLGTAPGSESGTVKLRKVSTGGGGISSSPLSVTLSIVDDAIPPEVTFTAPANGSAFAAGPVTVEGTLDDPGFTTLEVNGIAVSPAGTWSTSVPLAEGLNVVTAIARDQVGNIGTATLELVLDTQAPTVVIDSPPDGFVTSEPAISVAGMINDIVVGTVGGDNALVTVNGITAQVDNRSFLAGGVPLQLGANIITATAEDAAGNTAFADITVTREDLTGQPRVLLVSGDNQTGAIFNPLAAPLVISLQDNLGSPVAGQTVIFKVIENSGTLSDGASTARGLAVTSDAAGQALVTWTLGSRAGAGNNVAEASAVGFQGKVLFTATALAAAPDKINVDTGNNQTGAAGEPLAEPFTVVVTDAGHNRLPGVPVTFAVTQGGGSFSGAPLVTVDTDGSGRATVLLTLGTDEGFDNNRVEASFPAMIGLPATFVATGKVPGDPALTRVTGVVLDNTNNPVPGVTLSIEGTGLSAQSDAQGLFAIDGAPVGHVLLLADGGTTTRPGVWPSLEFELTTVAGRDNDLGRPIFLLPLDQANQLCVDETTGGTLTLPQVPGFALTVEAGATTFLDGTKTGCITVTTVHADKVPMTPNFGQQPRFIVTIQPAGAHFDPPAALILPNTDGLAPGEVTEMYSFDHDLGAFVSIGTGTVSDDGLVVASDPGVGVIKAGWHCGGNPASTGGAENAHVVITQVVTENPDNVGTESIMLTNESFATIVSTGGPRPGAYDWQSSDSSIVEILPPSSGPNDSSVTIKAKNPGIAEITVRYTCASGASAADILQVESEVVVTIEDVISICKDQTDTFNVTISPSPLPMGKEIVLRLNTISENGTSNVGSATFEDGSTEMLIIETTVDPVKVVGVTPNTVGESIELVAEFEGEVVAREVFRVLFVELDTKLVGTPSPDNNKAGNYALRLDLSPRISSRRI